MGINFNKVHIDQFPMICPPSIVNPNEAGSVYFVIHEPKSFTDDIQSKKPGSKIGKTSHFAFSIDVTGSSTPNQFISTHFDLSVHSKNDYTTQIRLMAKTHGWDHYYLVKKLGRIPLNQIQQYNMPFIFVKNMETYVLQHAYDPLFQQNNGPQWSSTLNCQTFTRSAIQLLGFQFPPNIEVISDIMPTLFDIYVQGSLTTAQAIEGSTEICSN